MANPLIIARVWDQPASSVDLPEIVRTLVLELMPQDDARWQVDDIDEGELEIELPNGRMTVHADHVSAELRGISSEVVRLIHAIAKAADLAIVSTGGSPQILLSKVEQLDLLSPELRADSAVASTPAELFSILSAHYEVPDNPEREARRQRDLLYSQWTREHVDRPIGSGDPEPNVPDLNPTPGWRAVYISVRRPKEGSLLSQITRHIRKRSKEGKAMPPAPMHGSSWQIRLPDGRIFRCVLLPGCRPGRGSNTERDPVIAEGIEILRDFAEATGRLTATIVKGRLVVVSDGRKYLLAECESRRAMDEDD